MENEVVSSPLLSRLVKKTRNSICNIKKPLIPLKATLFFWFGFSSSVYTFIIILFTQYGLSVSQISVIYIMLPPVQFFFPVLAGIIADKIGRAKPVLIGTMLIVIVLLNSMLLAPSIKDQTCNDNNNSIEISCNPLLTIFTNAELCNASKSYSMIAECIQNCPTNISHNNHLANKHIDLSCLPSSLEFNVTKVQISVNVSLPYSKCEILIHNSTWCDTNCSKQCSLLCNYERKKDKTSLCESFDKHNNIVFVIGLLLIVLYHSLLSTCFHILDVTSMMMVKAHDSDFGRERFWSISGSMVFSLISGYLVDISSESKDGPKNIASAIYLADVIFLLAFISMLKLDVQIKKPGMDLWKKFIFLLKDIDAIVFFLVLLILGTCWAFVQMFTSLLLNGLGASGLLLGLDMTVKNLYGLPFLLTSNFWVKKIGNVNLLVLGFFGYTIICLGYSYMVNPWYCLLFETTAILTYHLLWVAVISHSYDLAPDGLTATIISAAGALHFGIGKGTGSLVGGLTMGKFGTHAAYRLLAYISFVSGFAFAAYIFIRKRYKRRFRSGPV